METDAAVDKITDLQGLSTAAWKSLPAFHTVPTGPTAANQQSTKPDRSLATKTGHFHLLPTAVSLFQAMDAAGKDSAIKHVMSGVNPQGCQVRQEC